MKTNMKTVVYRVGRECVVDLLVEDEIKVNAPGFCNLKDGYPCFIWDDEEKEKAGPTTVNKQKATQPSGARGLLVCRTPWTQELVPQAKICPPGLKLKTSYGLPGKPLPGQLLSGIAGQRFASGR